MRNFVFLFLKIVLLMMSVAYVMFALMIDMAYGIAILRDVEEVARLIFLPIPLFLTISVVPFFYTIVMSFRLLMILELKKDLDHRFLLVQQIQKATLYYAISLSLSLPFVYLFVQLDDSPGFLLMFIILAFSGYVLSAFAYIFEELFHENKM